MQWLTKNKAWLGGFLVVLAQALRLVPADLLPHSVIEGVQTAGAILGGAGVLPSDSAVKNFGSAAK